MRKVFTTRRFDKRCESVLSIEQQHLLANIFDAISSSHARGKPLGPWWFREIRLRDKRLYFVENESSVLFIAVSDKDAQQDTIDWCRQNLDAFRNELYR